MMCGGIFPTKLYGNKPSGKPERILPPQLTVTFDKILLIITLIIEGALIL